MPEGQTLRLSMKQNPNTMESKNEKYINKHPKLYDQEFFTIFLKDGKDSTRQIMLKLVDTLRAKPWLSHFKINMFSPHGFLTDMFWEIPVYKPD